jgi:uncharacterized protein
MAKPHGAICNLNCAYRFYLSEEKAYPGSAFRMSDGMLERFIRQDIETHGSTEITFTWQGGEPTLMGLVFFGRALELE